MFTHLHVHTEYSMLDGLSRVDRLVRRAVDLGMDSLAITDHGGMYGAIDFYRAASDAGIRPIIGCEMYVAQESRHGRSPRDKSPHHLTVLSKDARGYQNLLKLVSKAHLEGFYYRPRVDRELLEKHHEGLIVLSGCASAEVPGLIAQGRMEEAKASAGWYQEVFDDYYLELMEHEAVEHLPEINKGLVQLSGEMGIPVVATNDSHYVNREEASLQDILICIHTNTNIKDERRLKMEADSYYLRSPEEMEKLFSEVPEAISNTQLIADMCGLELDFSRLRLPEFDVPDGMTADDYLSQLCWEGLRRRFSPITSLEEERLAYELEVIKHTQFADYFLVGWDIAQFVRERDIYFAIRGSAAASLALYCLGVTDINPLPYRLVFERFLNMERKEMPDLDFDFQDDRRQEVINYVVSKYGRDHVAQIITFGTLGARASIRDVGRALAMPYADVDNVARQVPLRLNITLDEALSETPELREMYGADEGIERLIDTARALEGITRHSSTHAAGVLISKEPLDDVVPLQRPVKGDDDSVVMTQYAMGPIALLGLLKMDFLGLVNLTTLARALELIAGTRGIQISLHDIPLDDKATFELLSRGETVGVFQLEGTGVTRYIQELKPSSLSDVAAMIALYRPGPMEHITTFIEAKHGRKEPSYPHPALQEILEETYGVIVYQDQVLHIARIFAGYTLGEADIVRKAMGKKIPEIMAQERDKFIQGALSEGYSEKLANEVFALIEPFAGYAFNKAHSVSYGLISYWTAYLKANYPAEYMVALLNSYLGNTERVAGAINECRRLKIPVSPPDINRSHAEFSIETSEDGVQGIGFGLTAIKNVGASAVRPLVEAAAKEGPFSSIEQMCRLADMTGLNRKTLESLIKAGAFDDFGDRGALLSVVDRVLSLAQSEAKLKASNQTSMFDLFGESVPTPLANIELDDVRTPESEKQQWEVELLGMALSDRNPLNALVYSGDSETIVFRNQLNPEMDGRKVTLAGQVSSVTHRVTRNQRPFTIATLALMDGAVEVFIWEELQERTRSLWEERKLVVVVGTVRTRDDQISISAASASEYTVPDASEPDASRPDESNADDHRGQAEARSVEVAAPQVRPTRDSGGHVDGKAAVEPGPDSLKRLSLRIRESDRPADDGRLLDDIKRLLLENQ
ncbi:MAG: DNA polymerase III subunit alpha, partial [Chloroflexi bacterium]|nr:DNA polymerase III subunit alpha [Chloroflexota bacterium]